VDLVLDGTTDSEHQARAGLEVKPTAGRPNVGITKRAAGGVAGTRAERERHDPGRDIDVATFDHGLWRRRRASEEQTSEDRSSHRVGS
jgi:hypothetical protein